MYISAIGDYVSVMDADLQDSPELLIEMSDAIILVCIIFLFSRTQPFCTGILTIHC